MLGFFFSATWVLFNIYLKTFSSEGWLFTPTHVSKISFHRLKDGFKEISSQTSERNHVITGLGWWHLLWTDKQRYFRNTQVSNSLGRWADCSQIYRRKSACHILHDLYSFCMIIFFISIFFFCVWQVLFSIFLFKFFRYFLWKEMHFFLNLVHCVHGVLLSF